MDYTLYIQERRRRVLEDEYDDFAYYLDTFAGDVSLAFHWFNEDRKRNELPTITSAQADEYAARWRGF